MSNKVPLAIEVYKHLQTQRWLLQEEEKELEAHLNKMTDEELALYQEQKRNYDS